MAVRCAAMIGLLLGWMLPAGSTASLRPELGWKVGDVDTLPMVQLPDNAEARLEPETSLFQGQRMQRVILGGGADWGTAHTLELDGVQYVVAFYAPPQSTIFHIETKDLDFTTPDGIRVGSMYDDVRAAAANERPAKHNGLCAVCLPSGWAAVFDTPKSCKNRGLRNASVGMLLRNEGACGE